MRVKLVFEKSFQETRGLLANTFSETVDVSLPDHIEQAHLVSAISYAPKHDSDGPNSDAIANIWDYQDESRLVGKLLTYVDATFTDKEQRQAHKDLVKDLVYAYFQDLRDRAHQLANAK